MGRVAWFSFSVNAGILREVRSEVTWEELFGWSADLSLFSHSVSNVRFGSSPDCAKACCFPYSFRRALEVQNLQYIYWFSCGGRTKNSLHYPMTFGQKEAFWGMHLFQAVSRVSVPHMLNLFGYHTLIALFPLENKFLGLFFGFLYVLMLLSKGTCENAAQSVDCLKSVLRCCIHVQLYRSGNMTFPIINQLVNVMLFHSQLLNVEVYAAPI